MAEEQEMDLMNWLKVDLLQDEASSEGIEAIRYFAHKLHEAKSNPHLQVAMLAQLRSNNLIPPVQEEGACSLDKGNHLPWIEEILFKKG